MNNTELKQFLAGQLPEKIGEGIIEGRFYWIEHCISGVPIDWIRDTEWPAIVAMVEGKLVEYQQTDYDDELTRISNNKRIWQFELDWPTRAEALMSVLGKE